jgi:cytochrome c556
VTQSQISRTAAACIAVLALGAPQLALAEKPIKELMGENFGGLQVMLYSLIRGDYRAVPGQVDVIATHAEELTHMAPKGLSKDDRAQFLAYATNMGAHATDLKTISQTLMKRDEAREEAASDELREALAGHYGGMVTMCVSCHNRFRPDIVE